MRFSAPRFLAPFAAVALMASAAPAVAENAAVEAMLSSGSDDAAFAKVQAGAEAGDPELNGYLGWFYDFGRFVPQDRARAAELYRSAADNGDAFSQWRLAVMIDDGLVEGSSEEAVALFRKAAGQKFADGMVGLAVMHAMGRGVEQDYEAAMRYYQAAARMGNSHGLQGIGVLYANGEGVEQDMDEAVAYWLVASAAGNATSGELLAEFMPEGETATSRTLVARADAIARNYNVAARFEMTADANR